MSAALEDARDELVASALLVWSRGHTMHGRLEAAAAELSMALLRDLAGQKIVPRGLRQAVEKCCVYLETFATGARGR